MDCPPDDLAVLVHTVAVGGLRGGSKKCKPVVHNHWYPEKAAMMEGMLKASCHLSTACWADNKLGIAAHAHYMLIGGEDRTTIKA